VSELPEGRTLTQSKGETVAEFYGQYPELYDRLANGPGSGLVRRAVLSHLDINRDDTVVEFGCGTGGNLPYLSNMVGPDGCVIGVDITPEFTERAAKRTETHPSVSIVQGDATSPPVQAADIVIETFVTGVLPDPASVISDWTDICRSGGQVLLADPVVTHPLGRVLSPAFRAFNAATARSGSLIDAIQASLGRDTAVLSRHPGRTDSPKAESLFKQRIDSARRALDKQSTETEIQKVAFGFISVQIGEID
jgi:ubiquinone/menaquinone biosynthesis C-methylase UbiE